MACVLSLTASRAQRSAAAATAAAAKPRCKRRRCHLCSRPRRFYSFPVGVCGNATQATIPATLTQEYLFMPQQMKTCFVVQVCC